MDTVVILAKLDSLKRCVDRLQQKKPVTVEALKQDIDLQDIIVLNMTRAVQLCVDITAHILSQSQQPLPPTMGQGFVQLAVMGVLDANLAERLKKAVGLRNLAVHNYEAIEWAIVFQVLEKQLVDFQQFAKHVLQFIDQTNKGNI